MPDPIDNKLYDLEFGVEVSTRYHAWRRARLESYVTWTRATALLGAIASLMGAVYSRQPYLPVIIGGSAVAALVTLFDLVFQLDARARLHTDLYQRFKTLQAEIARHRSDALARVDAWAADAQEIRRDEPPVFWALYFASWNQALVRREVASSQFRKIKGHQRILSQLLRFRPHDFPLVGAPQRQISSGAQG